MGAILPKIFITENFKVGLVGQIFPKIIPIELLQSIPHVNSNIANKNCKFISELVLKIGKGFNTVVQVEFQDGNSNIVIDGNMKQTVYIFKCVNSTIRVNGKVNSITMDSCKKCAVVFDNSVAGIEIINCQSVKAQVIGSCPIINGEQILAFKNFIILHLGHLIIVLKNGLNFVFISENFIFTREK